MKVFPLALAVLSAFAFPSIANAKPTLAQSGQSVIHEIKYYAGTSSLDRQHFVAQLGEDSVAESLLIDVTGVATGKQFRGVFGAYSKTDPESEAVPPPGSGYIGIPNPNTYSYCMDVNQPDGSTRTGNVTYTWSWQNRDDSNGDGTKDSNPGWVLVGVYVSYERHDHTGPLEC